LIREYLDNHILLADGAMGTYYSEITGDNVSLCEYANIEKPDVIKRIHREYIEAGARLIRTNTFAANGISLGTSREVTREVIEKGFKIAQSSAKGKDVYVAASIGPIPDSSTDKDNIDILEEYKFITDTFLDQGEDIFIFETFSSLDYLWDITEYIKTKKSTAFILVQFAVAPDGLTREGISISRIVKELRRLSHVDAFGFNCGSGPTHLYNSLKKLNIFEDALISVLPNAGYPELINERTVYVNNPEYFATKMEDIKKLGARIVGGCCGTTPEHTRKLASVLKLNKKEINSSVPSDNVEDAPVRRKSNEFLEKLKRNEFVIAVELDPPMDTSVEKILKGAAVYRDSGVDLITVADSPMSKVRVDSIMMASKIKREIGVDTMPHICCRDKNINAIRSNLLACHIEGIRNVLAVTGDPVPAADKSRTKGVFNLNSFKLMELISEMNCETFAGDEINIGGALNLNVLNKSSEIERMYRKADKGAAFFLTQPIYEESVIEFLADFRREKNIKILGGILPIVTYKNALFLNNELPGVHIPQSYMDRFHINMSKEEAEQVGIEIAVELVNKVKKYVDGLYIMTPFNRVEMIVKILREIS
jgi:methionine synthase / methylenetetrahydrofolate reductase(NADPH)